jgi:hypothetical protein
VLLLGVKTEAFEAKNWDIFLLDGTASATVKLYLNDKGKAY